jgi:hypothetical protein
MTKTFFIIILFFKASAFGQINSEKVFGLKLINSEISSFVNDTIIDVVYKKKNDNKKIPAFFVNGELVNESVTNNIDPEVIENVKIEKQNFEFDNVKYFGKILIETQKNYKPKFVSLNKLKLKYTTLNENSIIFQIDNEIITADYNKYLVDENYILRIVVETYENEKLNVSFINLITKSKENIKQSKDIIIHGKDELNK